MPVSQTYPGVYIEEITSGVRTIIGVPTSITAFVGRTKAGPTNTGITLTTFGDLERTFGGLDPDYPVSYAVSDFFAAGGTQAVVVRLFNDAGRAAAVQVAQVTEDSTETAVAKVADAAKAEAAKFTDDPEMSAAAAVATSAADEAAKPGATVDQVKGAARAAADAVTDTLSGGGIHNVAVNATFAAASDPDHALTMATVLAAARLEYRKSGLPVNEAWFAWEEPRATIPELPASTEGAADSP